MIGVKLENCKDQKGVFEQIVYWDAESSSVKWTEDYVLPDPALVPLLTGHGDSIIPALEYFLPAIRAARPLTVEPDSLEWQNHLYAFASLIAELKT